MASVIASDSAARRTQALRFLAQGAPVAARPRELQPRCGAFVPPLLATVDDPPANLIREPDVVLGKDRRRGFRAEQVIELGKLNFVIERVFRNPVQQHGHPPGKAFGFPYSSERTAGIVVETGGRFFRIVFDQCLREIADVASGEIEALGARRRHYMGGIAGEQQPAEAHRLGDEAAQRCDAFFQRRTGDEPLAPLVVESRPELLPEALVRPGIDVLRQAALQIVAATRSRTHRAERKAKRMADIDQFIGDRRRVGQNAKPAKRINALMRRDRARRNALAAHAVKSVATGNEVADHFMGLPVGAVSHPWRVSENIVQANVAGSVNGRRPNGGAAVHKIPGDLGLPVDHDRLPGQLSKRDALASPVNADLHALVHKAVLVHARADAGLVEQINGGLLDDAGADSPLNVFCGLPFEDDVVDAVLVQELSEQQSRRARSDNHDLCAHALVLSISANAHRFDEGAPHFRRLAVMEAKFVEARAQQRFLAEIGERNALGVEFARYVGQRDTSRLIGTAYHAARLLAGGHGFHLGEEAPAHHGDADVARPQILLSTIGDAPLADPGDDVLVDDVAGDEATVLVLERAHPGRHALLHVGLAALGDTREEPGDAQRILVIDRDPPFEVAAEKEAVRPQRHAADGPVTILLALPLAHTLVDEAVLELFEFQFEMPGRGVVVAAALSAAPIVVHPFEMYRIDGVFLALKPVARHVGEHDLAKAVGPGQRLPHRQFRRRQRAEIGKNEAGTFFDRIRLDIAAGPRGPGTGGIFIRLLEAAAGRVHQPAVIRAANTSLLDPTISHVGAAMGAVPVDQAVVAGAVAIEHEILAHKAYRLDGPGVEFAGACDRLPVTAQQLSHGRAGADPGQHFVTCGVEQAPPPRLWPSLPIILPFAW